MRWEESGRKLNQRELIIEAITKLLEKEGIEVGQIEERVSNWNREEPKMGKVSAFPRKRGRKSS